MKGLHRLSHLILTATLRDKYFSDAETEAQEVMMGVPAGGTAWGARPLGAVGKEPQLLTHQGLLLIWSSVDSQA